MPVLHRLQGRLTAQSRLQELLVAEPDIAAQRGFQLITRLEVMALQYILDASVEPPHHAGGLW